MTSIAEELRTQYSLGYTPDKNNFQAGYHKIQLTVKRKDLTVQDQGWLLCGTVIGLRIIGCAW